jgi:hypothetical protein
MQALKPHGNTPTGLENLRHLTEDRRSQPNLAAGPGTALKLETIVGGIKVQRRDLINGA